MNINEIESALNEKITNYLKLIQSDENSGGPEREEIETLLSLWNEVTDEGFELEHMIDYLIAIAPLKGWSRELSEAYDSL